MFFAYVFFQGSPITNTEEEIDQVNYFSNFSKFSLNLERTVAIDILLKTCTSLRQYLILTMIVHYNDRAENGVKYTVRTDCFLISHFILFCNDKKIEL